MNLKQTKLPTSQQFYCEQMLIDPRPYTYEFRKPRYANPTYQSRNLYESLYQSNRRQTNDYFPQPERDMYSSAQKLPKKEVYQNEYKHLERNLSEVREKKSHQAGNYRGNQQPQVNPERQMEGYKLPAIKPQPQTERARVQSNLGSNMNHPAHSDNITQRKQGFERFRVYQRQQKPYNIISCYPKENQHNKLRSFPRKTLEDKLIESGTYHDFKNEKF